MAKENQKAKNPQKIAPFVVGSTTTINGTNIRQLNKEGNACEKQSYAINASKRNIWQENVKRTLSLAISAKKHITAPSVKREGRQKEKRKPKQTQR